MVAETGGPVLDGTSASLGLLDKWLEVPIAGGPRWDDGADWQAIGNMTAVPGALGPADMDMGQFERLENRVGFYYADVVISELPGSKWVCWRAQEFNRPPERGIGRSAHPTRPRGVSRLSVSVRAVSLEDS